MNARTQYLINVYATLNSAGRKDQFQRGRYNDPRHGCASFPADYDQAGPLLGCEPSEPELQALEAEGYIKRNRAGSITITDKGRAARTGSYGSVGP